MPYYSFALFPQASLVRCMTDDGARLGKQKPRHHRGCLATDWPDRPRSAPTRPVHLSKLGLEHSRRGLESSVLSTKAESTWGGDRDRKQLLIHNRPLMSITNLPVGPNYGLARQSSTQQLSIKKHERCKSSLYSTKHGPRPGLPANACWVGVIMSFRRGKR